MAVSQSAALSFVFSSRKRKAALFYLLIFVFRGGWGRGGGVGEGGGERPRGGEFLFHMSYEFVE